MTQIVVGLGTGRCGTRSLAGLIAAQDGGRASHERRPVLTWEGDPNPGRHLERAEGEVFADCGFYYLPYVEAILTQFPGVKFVCLQRDRNETVQSFLRARPINCTWFSESATGWDSSFPTYPGLSFEQAVTRYWHDYYDAAGELENDSFRVFPTEWLNSKYGVAEILDFAGVSHAVLSESIRITD